jgi:hypothetical protein
MSIRAERYGRYWAVYEHGILLCLTVYKKGALALLDRLAKTAPQSANPQTSNHEERSVQP